MGIKIGETSTTELPGATGTNRISAYNGEHVTFTNSETRPVNGDVHQLEEQSGTSAPHRSQLPESIGDGTTIGDDELENTFEIPLDKLFPSSSICARLPENSGSLGTNIPETDSSRFIGLPKEVRPEGTLITDDKQQSDLFQEGRSTSASKGAATSRSSPPSNSNDYGMQQSPRTLSSSSNSTSASSKHRSSADYTRSSSGDSTGNSNQESASKNSSHLTAKKRANDFKLPVTGVAAATYNGGWLAPDGLVPYTNDVVKLNKYLHDCVIEVEAGVPGKYLTVVMGNDISDLDSIVGTISYAFFLHCTGSEEDQCFVPVLNMRREDLALHTEAVWLFEVTGVDISNFIFVDEISLSYYHKFGSLRIVLVDHSRLSENQENLQQAVVEIVDHNIPQDVYPWVTTLEIEQVGSCCTIIAERYAAEAPELLAGCGVNRLLLGPILLDTANLDAKYPQCTPRDSCMAAFLIRGAGRYGRHGFFQLLRRMKYDTSILSTKDMMRKYFEQWTLGPGKTDVHGFKGQTVNVGMSTLALPLIEFLSRGDIIGETKRFRRALKLDLLLIVTGYYDNAKRYKREILVVHEEYLTNGLMTCFDAHSEGLNLSPLKTEVLPKGMMVFVQGNVTTPRKLLRQILTDCFAT